MKHKIDIQYYTSNEEIPTIEFYGSKRSLLKLGKLFFSFEACKNIRASLRALLSINSNQKVRVFLKQSNEEKIMRRINKEEPVFGWSLPRDQWKRFDLLLALLRSNKIREHEINPAFYEDVKVMITMGNRFNL